jgi:DNA-binding CsgD family transcriptional regulator
MTAEGTRTPAGSDPHPVAVRDAQADVDVVHRGAELVALSERFYGGVFVGAIVFVGLAALAALALLPLRATGSLERVTPALAIAVLLVALVPLALWRASALYRLARRRPIVELAMVVAAAALIVYPLQTALWWPSCALLMLLAVLVPPWRAMACCLVVLAANLAAHVVAGDLRETAAVSIIGLWIGYVSWTATFAFVPDRLAAYVLRLNVTRAPPRPPPLRVHGWVTADQPSPAAATDAEHAAASSGPAAALALDRLTARQLQVVALLADGLRYREVAACLSISVRQVERHVSHAITRLGVGSVYEVVALAVAEGMVPAPDRSGVAAGPAITRESGGSRG